MIKVSQPLKKLGCFKLGFTMQSNGKLSLIIVKRLASWFCNQIGQPLFGQGISNVCQWAMKHGACFLLLFLDSWSLSQLHFLCWKDHWSGCKEKPLNFCHCPNCQAQQKDPKGHQNQPWWMNSTRQQELSCAWMQPFWIAGPPVFENWWAGQAQSSLSLMGFWLRSGLTSLWWTTVSSSSAWTKNLLRTLWEHVKTTVKSFEIGNLFSGVVGPEKFTCGVSPVDPMIFLDWCKRRLHDMLHDLIKMTMIRGMVLVLRCCKWHNELIEVHSAVVMLLFLGRDMVVFGKVRDFLWGDGPSLAAFLVEPFICTNSHPLWQRQDEVQGHSSMS